MGFALFISLLAGLATAVGGALALLAPPEPDTMAVGLGFAGGVMLTVSLGDLLPEAFADYTAAGAAPLAAAGRVLSLFCIGAVLAVLLGLLLPEEQELFARGRLKKTGPASKGMQMPLQAGALRSALVTAAVVVAHNLPEGVLTLFTGYADRDMGLTMALAIGMHNLPEGIVIAVPVLLATGSRQRAFWAALTSGLAEPAGAMLAFLCLGRAIQPLFLSGLLCIVAGMMCAVSWCELLALGYRTEKHGAAISKTAFGGLLGCAVMSFGIYCIS